MRRDGRPRRQAFGGLDVLVHCAGIIHEAPLLDTPIADFDRVIAVNLRGSFLVGQAAIRLMEGTAKAPSVILIASDMAYYGRETFSPYVASKHGVLGLMRSWAKEFAPRILVNALCPGPIDTEMLGAANMSAGVAREGAGDSAGPLWPTRGGRTAGRLPCQRGRSLYHRTGHRHQRRERHAMIRNPIPWPNGARCAACVTFDMDADSLIHIATRPTGTAASRRSRCCNTAPKWRSRASSTAMPLWDQTDVLHPGLVHRKLSRRRSKRS